MQRHGGLKWFGLRVANGNIQFDVLLPFQDARERKLRSDSISKALESQIGKVLAVEEISTGSSPCLSGAPSEVFLERFNEERYWEAHEILEGWWRHERDGNTKRTLQGWILVCAALVHHQKCRDSVALEILRRASSLLPSWDAATQLAPGLDSVKLLATIQLQLRRRIVEPFRL